MRYNNTLNRYNNVAIEIELNKLPNRIKGALIRNGVTIEINDSAVKRLGLTVAGFYSYDDRKIVLKHNDDSIEYALLHEIGHALDHIANISNQKAIRSSYGCYEVPFNHDYFYSSVEEYVAQSISDFYNDKLPRHTIMYNELHAVLDCIA
jgi:hypothetical protein